MIDDESDGVGLGAEAVEHRVESVGWRHHDDFVLRGFGHRRRGTRMGKRARHVTARDNSDRVAVGDDGELVQAAAE